MTNILLQTLSGQDTHWLQTTGKLLQISAGKTIADRQWGANPFCLVLEGKLSVMPSHVEHSARTNPALTHFSQGEMMGVLSQADGGDRTQLVQAIEDSLVLAIPAAVMQQKLQDDPSFAAHFYQANALLLARRLNFLIPRLNPETTSAYQSQQEIVTVFSSLQDSDLDWLITVGTIQSIAPNTCVVQGNQPIDAMHILLDGALTVEVLDDARSPMLQAFVPLPPTKATKAHSELARLSRGNLIGETALVKANPGNVSIKAVRESKILSIPRWRLAAKLSHDVEFASRFYRVLMLILAHQQQLIQQSLGHDDGQTELEQEGDGILNKVALAEARFEWMLKRIQTELGTGREIQW
jgi:signal-transduction protein with cAMP-binding, CBS, and nucleotidyltransferase domain